MTIVTPPPCQEILADDTIGHISVMDPPLDPSLDASLVSLSLQESVVPSIGQDRGSESANLMEQPQLVQSD